MNIFNIYYITVIIASSLFLIFALLFGQYKLSLIYVIVLGIMYFILRKLRIKWMQMCLRSEDDKKLEDRVEDIEKKLVEKSRMLSEKIAESNIQRRITGAMTSTMELSKILRVILEAIVKMLNHDRAVLLLFDEKGRYLQARQAVGLSVKDLDSVTMRVTGTKNPFTRSIVEARPLIIENAQRFKDFVPFLADDKGAFPDAIVTMPLVAQDKIVGLVLVDHLLTKRPFEEEDLRNLLAYIQQAGMAVMNASAYQTEKNFHIVLKKEVDKARKELLDAQALIIQSERLAALGEMSAVVAHEIKNPMASIRACAQAIEQGITTKKGFDPKYLEYIKKEIDRLDKIVKSILMYSRPPEARLVSFQLKILVDETLDFMKKNISNQHITLSTALPEDLPPVMIGPEQTKQVLINILDNAIFFLKEKKKKVITVSLCLSGNKVMLSIEDTGGGIDPKIIPRIFEPFFTTKTQGTGLGLAICKKIIDSQNGTITVHNDPGRGVRVDIFFSGVKK